MTSREIRSASHEQLNVTQGPKFNSNSSSYSAACKEGVFCVSKTFTPLPCLPQSAFGASFCGGKVYRKMEQDTR